MRSIIAVSRWSSWLDRFEAAEDLLFASLDSMTASERVAALDGYEFLTGRLDALIYELRSPFAPPSGRRT
ncbi:hypothetical protein A5739_09840 [Mycobacterium colombiense]|nr:hypothetical protein A5732_09800 [Mycobacterium colombiense]OMC18487.1 hypothetical protein A5737_04560 [Mycobacterium colombiense]OMC32600.1 hypothetical protein A5739_09840 [Mycobacterium colombiense]